MKKPFSWHCFMFLQITFMSGLIEESRIFYLFPHSICCGIRQHVTSGKLYCTVISVKKANSALLSWKQLWPCRPPARTPGCWNILLRSAVGTTCSQTFPGCTSVSSSTSGSVPWRGGPDNSDMLLLRSSLGGFKAKGWHELLNIVLLLPTDLSSLK